MPAASRSAPAAVRVVVVGAAGPPSSAGPSPAAAAPAGGACCSPFLRGAAEGLAFCGLLAFTLSAAVSTQARPRLPSPPAGGGSPGPARARPGPSHRGPALDAGTREEPDANMPQWMKDMWKERTAARIDEQAFAEAEVPPELRHVARGAGAHLFVTFGTISVADFVLNWLAHVRRLGLGPYFVGALDEGMRDLCKERGVPTMLLSGTTILKGRSARFIVQGDGSFKKMGSVKTKFVQDLLELGISPILTDADVAWLRDPRPYFNSGNYKAADVLISGDCIDVPADRNDRKGCAHVNFNTGVLLLRSTPATKVFVESWKTKVRTSNIAWMRDQPAFNLLARLGPQTGLLRIDGNTSGRAVYLSGNSTIRMGVLPVWLFTNGHTFFVQNHHKYHPEPDGPPYSVHLTYQYGDTGAYAYGKRERMRQHGLWLVDADNYYSGRYLSITDAGAMEEFAGKEEVGWRRKDYITAIERHLAEDRLRRQTVRNGFALARALNRTLVLPAARCYCDKIWNNLNGCRAPGAETFRLPYDCPMDHLYDLPAMYRHNADFRAPGFLRDPRLPPATLADRARVHVEPASGKKQPAGPPADAVLRGPFNDQDAVRLLQPFRDRALIELTSLGPGTFCGHADKSTASTFDAWANSVLSHQTYYCFTEAWEAMGKPMNNPWEPQVVLRHCGKHEHELWAAGKIHPGRVTYVHQNPPECSCEWGFATPTPLGQCGGRP